MSSFYNKRITAQPQSCKKCGSQNLDVKVSSGNSNPDNAGRSYLSCLDCNQFVRWENSIPVKHVDTRAPPGRCDEDLRQKVDMLLVRVDAMLDLLSDRGFVPFKGPGCESSEDEIEEENTQPPSNKRPFVNTRK